MPGTSGALCVSWTVFAVNSSNGGSDETSQFLAPFSLRDFPTACRGTRAPERRHFVALLAALGTQASISSTGIAAEPARDVYIVPNFGHRIAHGTLIFSIGIGMTADVINPRAMSHGHDRLRFVRPVFIGDTLYVEVTIKEKRDDPKRPRHGVVIESCQILNQKGETVLACEHLLLVEKGRI